jgi:hypothetical protein
MEKKQNLWQGSFYMWRCFQYIEAMQILKGSLQSQHVNINNKQHIPSYLGVISSSKVKMEAMAKPRKTRAPKASSRFKTLLCKVPP